MSRRRGFTLVEAVVAIAVVSILAGMAAPLALKILNQRREAATRKGLKLAFEAMFGARDRRVPNMRSDFGWEPRGDLESLPLLVSAAASRWKFPRYGPNDHAAFNWGYNGPYWQGPVVDGRPADAWGHPIDLIVRYAGQDPNQRTWQVHSQGSGPGHDLYYPPAPATLMSYNVTILVVVNRVSDNIDGTVILRHCVPGWGELKEVGDHLHPRNSPQNFKYLAPSGVMELVFTPTGAGAFRGFTLPMDLLPGQTREVRVSL
jgi:prepilin-type N-terminal cleavage/methylation domain-containing protein